MELIIGGYAQGKLEYVLEKYNNANVYDENSINDLLEVDGHDNRFKNSEVNPCKIVLNNFHKVTKKLIEEGKDYGFISDMINKIVNECPDIIIISDEIGNGIVPIDKFERKWREDTGRLLCEIAQKACKVERIICKIPQRIK